MGSYTFRLAHALAAGLAGAAKWLLVLALSIVVAIPVMRLAADWYVRGRPDFRPYVPAPASAEYRQVVVTDATPGEARAVRDAVAGMRYRIAPDALRFTVVASDITCGTCAAEYVPYLELVRIQRRIVEVDGPALSWTIAHEVGHYVDDRYMTPEARDRFRRLRGIPPGMVWTGRQETEWQRRPNEDFAEVFAAVAQPSISVDPSTEWGPVNDIAPYERLLADVGVVLGQEAMRAGWREVLARDVALFRDAIASPPVREPLAAMFVLYVALGAIPPAARAWRDNADDEGVPLDRNVRPVLNKEHHTSHITGRDHVAHEGPHHGGGR